MCQERVQLNEYIKNLSIDTGEHPRVLWQMVYSMAEGVVSRKLGRCIDLSAEAKKYNMGKLDYIEKAGLIPAVYTGAQELFRRSVQ